MKRERLNIFVRGMKWNLKSRQINKSIISDLISLHRTKRILLINEKFFLKTKRFLRNQSIKKKRKNMDMERPNECTTAALLFSEIE